LSSCSGNRRLAKADLKIFVNYSSKPPIPIFSNLKSLLNKEFYFSLDYSCINKNENVIQKYFNEKNNLCSIVIYNNGITISPIKKISSVIFNLFNISSTNDLLFFELFFQIINIFICYENCYFVPKEKSEH
jgi:hypothetical protein